MNGFIPTIFFLVREGTGTLPDRKTWVSRPPKELNAREACTECPELAFTATARWMRYRCATRRKGQG